MIGVEGYVELAVLGLVVGINAVCFFKGESEVVFLEIIVIGSLVYYIIYVDSKYF